MTTEDLPREVMKHGFELRSVRESLQRTDANVLDVRKDVEKLEEKYSQMEKAFNRWVSAAEATETHTKQIAERAITTRQFYVATGILIVAIIGLVLGIHS